MEKHVVSMELSRELYKAGYPQKPIGKFYWIISMTTPYHVSFVDGDKDLLPKHRNDYYVALLADEILEQLPDYIRNPENGDLTPLWFCRNKYTKDFIAQYHIAFSAPLYEQRADTLADVMAKMWLYLKENNLLPTQSERK